jgi:hypothetical protein
MFAAATNKFPSTFGEKATEKGPEPAENGEPLTGIKEPGAIVVLTEYIEIVLLSPFATAANKFLDTFGEKATERGFMPVENGEP